MYTWLLTMKLIKAKVASTHLAMLVIQVESTPCIINRAVLASLDAETQLCLRQMAQRPGLGLLTLAH